MKKFTKIKFTQLLNEIISQESEMNDNLLEDHSRTKSEHKMYADVLKEFKDEAKKCKPSKLHPLEDQYVGLIYRFLDQIGFDSDDANSYLLSTLVDWKK